MFIDRWQIAIKNRIGHNLYMNFGMYLIQIGQELTLGDENWCGGNISSFNHGGGVVGRFCGV
jgi:hypothetical protein